MRKERVLITGASGTMGLAAFKELWTRRDCFELVLLLRDSRKNRKLFGPYLKEDGLKIVWGDLLDTSTVAEACRGIDICLHAAALISPEADRQPEAAERINHQGTRNLVAAIEAENPEHIRMVYIGSVAMYGDRLPPLHVGRVGDPIVPSVFDFYGLSKIRGELALMESRIRHKVSLRQTFIMIPDLFSLKDPIMFHQPLNSLMEACTERDSGRLLAACAEQAKDAGVWGKYYNIGGGASSRVSYLEFLDRVYRLLGLRYRKVMRRNWFALKNFHMLFFDDSGELNRYLQHWEGGQDLETFYAQVWKMFPWYLKMVSWLCRHVRPFRSLVEWITFLELKKLAGKPRGILHWLREAQEGDPRAQENIRVFFGSLEEASSIPAWDVDMPDLNPEQPSVRLTHGYDEEKAGAGLEHLDEAVLLEAAAFRGWKPAHPGNVDGTLASPGLAWTGDPLQQLDWKCGMGHHFRMSPHAMLMGGHCCPQCISPPWDQEALADYSPFAAQILRPNS